MFINDNDPNKSVSNIRFDYIRNFINPFHGSEKFPFDYGTELDCRAEYYFFNSLIRILNSAENMPVE